MTKKTSNKKTEDNILEEKLNKEIISKYEEKNERLKDKIKKLEKQLSEKEEILKNTQLQYITLKNEFDSFTNRIKDNEEKQKQEIFEKTILKFLPILEDFMKSYDHLPKEFKNHKWTEGIVLINKKILKFLEDNGIEIIDTKGDIDEQKHEIIGVNPVNDDNKKNKIIQEVTKGYTIKTKNGYKVLIPAKVIIGQ